MLESLKRNFTIEDFPQMTFILAAIMLAVFLFTRTDIIFYENVFGFVPARPQIYAFTTYIFIHANFTHIFFNLLFLIIAGIAIEERLGALNFLAIFFASGYVAVMFDIFGRFITAFFDVFNKICTGSFLSCVNFGGPFVGASGAIFGVMAVASMIKPFDKIPTVLVVIAFLPVAQYYYAYQTNFDYFTTILVSTFLALVAISIFFISPGTVPILVGMIAFLLSWIFVILFNSSGGVSDAGHLGGVIGGIISYFIFAKSKKAIEQQKPVQ